MWLQRGGNRRMRRPATPGSRASIAWSRGVSSPSATWPNPALWSRLRHSSPRVEAGGREGVTPGSRSAFAEVAGIEPTGRGVPVPLVLKTRGATRPRAPPSAKLSVRAAGDPGPASARMEFRSRRPNRGGRPGVSLMDTGDGQDGQQAGPDRSLDFDDTFRRCFGPMVRSLAVAAGDREGAADCVQDAFMRAFVRWHRVSKLDDPVGWIRHVAVNRMRDRFRKLERGGRAVTRLRSQQPLVAEL